MLNQLRNCDAAPPWNMTVNMTMRLVVVSMACLASDTVFLIARAKLIAPRKPAQNSMCWKLSDILGLRPRFSRNESGYTLAALPTRAQNCLYCVKEDTITHPSFTAFFFILRLTVQCHIKCI
jgi:hypothetical protein